MHNGQKGDLAEIAFIYEATQRDLLVLEPRGDNSPYDVAIDNGDRIFKVQVKSTNFLDSSPRRKHPSYIAAVRHKDGEYIQGQRRKATCYKADMFDVLAVTVTPCKAWYLVPVKDAISTTVIHLYPGLKRPDKPTRNPGGPARFEKYLDYWEIFEPQDI